MNGLLKFLAGAAATALMAFLAHGALGLGSGFIDRLESDAVSAVGHAGGAGVAVSFVRTPSLQRVAILSGTADAPTREQLLTEVRAVAGVRDAHWSAAEPAMPLLLETALLLLLFYLLGFGIGALLWRRPSR